MVMVLPVIFITLWLNSADKLFFLIFPRKWALTFYAYCLMSSLFSGENKIFQIFGFFFSEKVRSELFFFSEKIRPDISCDGWMDGCFVYRRSILKGHIVSNNFYII